LSEADAHEVQTTQTIKTQNACNREIASPRARLFMPAFGFPMFTSFEFKSQPFFGSFRALGQL
jgi:hypothetical protein